MADDPATTPPVPVVGLDSAEGFRVLVELSPDAVFVIQDGFHVFANRRGLDLLGARALADLQTRPAVEFMHHDDRGVARDRLTSIVGERRELAYVEERVVRLDGTVVDIEAAGRPIVVGGRPAALVVVRDISSRRRAEAALRAADQRFQAAFRHAPSGVLITDLSGVVSDANPAAGLVFDRSPDLLVGTAVSDLVDADQAEALVAGWQRLREGQVEVATADLRVTRADGSVAWVGWRATALVGEPAVIAHVADVTLARAAQEGLRRRATLDSLTGLPNRGVVVERLEAAARDDDPVTLLFLDLDGFKSVNDRFGHTVGDTVLTAVGRRLRATVPAGDLVGRLGGDEFAVVLTGPRAAELAVDVAARIRAAVRNPIAITGTAHRVQVGVSIGVATRAPGTGLTPEGLVAAADADMYRAKAAQGRPPTP